MSYDKKFMLRAIELAEKGVGAVNPNPLVGAVIVRDGHIIAEGYHTKYGELHAEREALKAAKDAEVDVAGAEMYVTLEPCCHKGKQPPCTEAIIEAGISRVYVGSNDPNPLVAGKGIWQLRDAGIEVITNCMKEECDKLNPVFFHYINTNLPYVVYKYAMSMDGKTSNERGKGCAISNDESRQMVQEMRNRYTAIMVGIGTVLADDPSLECHMEGGRNPVRIICDDHLQIPMDSEIVKTAGDVRTYIASLAENERREPEKVNELARLGIGTLLLPPGEDGRVDLHKLMELLGKMKIDSILLEGGGELAYSMMRDGFVDEVEVFIAPKMFGGRDVPTPLAGEGNLDGFGFELRTVKECDGDVCLIYDRR